MSKTSPSGRMAQCARCPGSRSTSTGGSAWLPRPAIPRRSMPAIWSRPSSAYGFPGIASRQISTSSPYRLVHPARTLTTTSTLLPIQASVNAYSAPTPQTMRHSSCIWRLRCSSRPGALADQLGCRSRTRRRWRRQPGGLAQGWRPMHGSDSLPAKNSASRAPQGHLASS